MPGENTETTEKTENKALEQASGVKTEDEQALEHIQQVLDKASEDGDGKGEEKPADGNSGDGGEKPGDSAVETNEGTGDKKPEEKPADDNSGKGEDNGEKKDGDDGGEAGKKGDDVPPDDKVKKLLDSKVFETFRKEGQLDPEDWDCLMDGIEALLKEVVDGREKLRELDAIAERRRTEELSDRLDSVFDGLGDEFSEAFGKGAASKLDKALMDNRNAVLQKAETLILGYQAQGKEVTLEDAVKEAAGLWASQNFKRPQERKPQQDRRSQFISKPAGERPPAAKGDEAALDFIEKFTNEHRKE